MCVSILSVEVKWRKETRQTESKGIYAIIVSNASVALLCCAVVVVVAVVSTLHAWQW